MRVCDEWSGGFGWIAAEPDYQERASHALVADGRVWLVEPTAGEGVLERVRAAGDPAGVLQLIGRHGRDCASVARELGVPHHVVPLAPPAGSPFELVPIGRGEIAVWWPAEEALVVAEALGTAHYFRAPGERLGLHPFRRLAPPRALALYPPRRILVGHGTGIHEGAADALADVLEHGRSRTLPWLAAAIARRNT